MEPLNVLHEVSPKSELGSSGVHTSCRERGNGKRQGGRARKGDPRKSVELMRLTDEWLWKKVVYCTTFLC